MAEEGRERGEVMELVDVLGNGSALLVRRGDSREALEIAAVHRAGGLLVYAKTEGELTCEAFGSPWHVGCAVLNGEAAESLAYGLGDPLEQGVESPIAALARFFLDEDLQLADLLDFLDAQGIPYEYRSFDTYAELFRSGELAA
ncbi:hypothetical protein [uncultured Parolsenella sp.]|uniref:hypothetical protein n=1 Tax=uncultured Parolsenella sp. TaxID=2083008 RepID=UPI0025DBB409|nr:hypothetical protein [uncultured Parolsenella sp.]